MSFEITVVRGQQKGRLKFTSGSVSVDTDCWWDPNVKISSGTYKGYATHMSNKTGSDGKKRQAIWLGKNVKYGNGTQKSSAIFIHMGKSAGWSDGCIVCAESEVIKIWNAIAPKEQPNVHVKVSDE